MCEESPTQMHATTLNDHCAARLTARQFDALDLLHTINADHEPVTRDRLALELGNITTEAAHVRMTRLERAGLVTVDRGTNTPSTYTPSPLGRRLYQGELLRMVGVVAPPPLHEHLQRATEATVLLHLTEPRMTA